MEGWEDCGRNGTISEVLAKPWFQGLAFRIYIGFRISEPLNKGLIMVRVEMSDRKMTEMKNARNV